MVDSISKEKRSLNMSRIKGTNTKIELLVRRELYKRGYRYRLHKKELPGKPDIYIKKFKMAVFVNGCFWHHHGCDYYRIPKSNKVFWGKS